MKPADLLPYAVAAALCFPLPLSAQGAANELANPGFEEARDGTLAGWEAYGRAVTLDGDTFHGGRQSIRCTSTGETDGMGARQIIRYDQPDKRPIILGGWSKADDVGAGGDYCVYLDIFYEDGTPWWGVQCEWSRHSHDWEYGARIYHPAKPVREIQAFVFLRRTTGTVWFDDLFIARSGLHLTDIRTAFDYPRTPHGLRVSAGLTEEARWTCSLLSAEGALLDSLSGSGRAISWFWQGRTGAIPAAARLSAVGAAGGKVESEVRVRFPERTANPVPEGYVVWTRNSMQKVYPTEFPDHGDGPEAVLSLARNEREGLQVAITTADQVALTEVRVEIGAFTDETGQVLPPEQLRWHVIGYVWVEAPSSHPLAPAAPNWCPEVLLPAKPFNVPGGRTQTVWLDLHASEEVRPGTYRGKVTIAPANAPSTQVQVSVRVRRFALPRTPRMKTAFALMDGFTRHTYGGLTPELRRKGWNLMLEHRLNPDDISRTEPPGIEDLLYAREHGLNAFNILNLVPRPTGSPLWVCYSELADYPPTFNQDLASRLDGYLAELRRHDLAKAAYFYGFDERGDAYDDLIKGICRFLKERYPEVSTFTTAGYMYEKRRDTPAGYQDYMDWYCPLTSRYDLELSDRLRALGKQVWWYVCCGPQYPYANFASMDYPSIEGRLLGWMTFGYKADGLLFWHVNLWNQNALIDWHDPYLDWDSAAIWGMTGDGCLTYPTPQGPVSSIRLENIRDGIEDYDYLSLLADSAGREAASQHFNRLVTNMTEYQRDPAELYRAREQMADEIEAGMQPSMAPSDRR